MTENQAVLFLKTATHQISDIGPISGLSTVKNEAGGPFIKGLRRK